MLLTKWLKHKTKILNWLFVSKYYNALKNCKLVFYNKKISINYIHICLIESCIKFYI